MIQLTQKGKETYGDYKIEMLRENNRLWNTIVYTIGGAILASSPTELKALVDLGLVEIV